MKRTMTVVSVVAIVLSHSGHPTPAHAAMFGTNPSGTGTSLVIVDPSTGAAAIVGAIGFPQVAGLAGRQSDVKLFGSIGSADFANMGKILTINPFTGVGTAIGGDPSHLPITALAFSPGGTLYGTCTRNNPSAADTLCTIDTFGGTPTDVGSFDPPNNFLAGVDGLAFSGSTLYASTRTTATNGAALYTVNTSTGQATLVKKICAPTACPSGTQIAADVAGLSFIGSTLYGSTSDGNIITINTTTGVYSVVGSISIAGSVQDLTQLNIAATGTATQTPTATRTPTQTSTRTFTATETPTATPLCSALNPVNNCAPGAGAANTDCLMEWYFNAVELLRRGTPVPEKVRGVPRNRLICYEGDPRCDVDANLANKSCTMQTAICINNTDPRFPGCTPSTINTFEVKLPNPARVLDAVDTANLATLEGQGDGGPGGFGLTVVEGQSVKHAGTPNSTQNLCSAPLNILVPLRIYGTRTLLNRKLLRTVVTTALNVKDTDSLTMECRPSTCGNGFIQKDHETCDDNNRISGDGCDQGCQIEPGFTCSGQPSVCTAFTPTRTRTATATGTPTQTPSATPTSPPTATNTSALPTSTPTDTATVGPSNTPTITPTITDTPTITETPTITDTPTTTGTPTVTATPSSTATPGAAVCGNGVVEGGETCDDGNTVTNPPNDTCPADCTIITCTPSGITQKIAVSFTGGSIRSISVLVEYPDGTVQVPGTGTDDSVAMAFGPAPSGFLLSAFDFDYALSAQLAGNHALAPAELFRVTFDTCLGAAPPTAAAYKCTVTKANVSGITCSVAVVP